MIEFDTLEYKNFLSTGQIAQKFSFLENKTTLILGRNGSGKSTLLDALAYALFGRAFRNININQLINSINKKELLVQLKFKVKNKTYEIRRGMKPNIFEIWENGVLKHQDAAPRAYQEYLEKEILKFNFRTFNQIIVLGIASFIPFMKLPAASRREFIEQLLDLQLFSVMNVLLKQKIIDNKIAISDLEHELELAENKLEMHNKHVNQLKQNNQELIDAKNDKIEEYAKLVAEWLEAHDNTQAVLEELDQKYYRNEYTYQQKNGKLFIKYKDTETKISKIEKDIKFFEDSANCPTCNQEIKDDFKGIIILEKRKELKLLKSEINNIKKESQPIQDFLNECKEAHDATNRLVEFDNYLNHDISLNKKFIVELQSEIEVLQRQSNEQSELISGDTLSMKTEIIELHTKKEELLNNRFTYDTIQTLLSDGGIKTQIIKQYIPIINKLINKHLDEMNFLCQFKFDEEFNEQILSRYREDYTYDSFSEGEKLRIDLAVLFTWRDISKMRNSISTNLLILDEIFDSSLDVDGVDDFIKILEVLTNDTNTVIISHKGDQLIDKFDNVIMYVKHNNFSKKLKADEIEKIRNSKNKRLIFR